MYRRILFGLLGSLLLIPISPVSAAQPIEAYTFGLVDPEPSPQGGHVARIVLDCAGTGNENTVSMLVQCRIWDSSGVAEKQIFRQRAWTGPACNCVVNAFNMVMPVRYCSKVIATMRDSSTQEKETCKTYKMDPNDADPPYTSPPPGPARILDCADPAGAEKTVMDRLGG